MPCLLSFYVLTRPTLTQSISFHALTWLLSYYDLTCLPLLVVIMNMTVMMAEMLKVAIISSITTIIITTAATA